MKQVDRGIAFYSNFRIKPELKTVWLEKVCERINEMSQEVEFQNAFLYQDANDADSFTFYEQWSDSNLTAFMERQKKNKNRALFEKQLIKYLNTPRTFLQLIPLKEWKKK